MLLDDIGMLWELCRNLSLNDLHQKTHKNELDIAGPYVCSVCLDVFKKLLKTFYGLSCKILVDLTYIVI